MALIDISKKNNVAIIGDSITAMGHYITFMKDYLDRKYTGNDINFINLGRSGETLSGLCENNRPTPRGCLFERIDEISESLIRADAFIFCYGMNDGIFEPFSESHMLAFKNGVNKLVRLLSEFGKPILAVTPPPFDAESYFKWNNSQPQPSPDAPVYPQPYLKYNDVLDKFADWLLSQKGKLIDNIADIHYPLNEYIANKKLENKNYSYGDGIHPAKDGHHLIAKIILKSLIDYDMPDYS